MQKYTDIVTSKSGDALAGITVKILNQDGTTATIYSDNGTTQIPEGVVTTDGGGIFSFYAANGRYNLQISGPGINTYTLQDKLLYDPKDDESSLAGKVNAADLASNATGKGMDLVGDGVRASALANTTNGKGADLVANAAKKVASIAALRALRIPQGSDAQTCILDGNSSANDTGGGAFIWSSTSTATDDGITVIAPNSNPSSGRWLRLFSGNAPIRISTIAQLKSLTAPSSNVSVFVNGYAADNDGGGGQFIWSATASNADDGGTIIAPNTNPAQGRWLRLFTGPMNIKWFGAKGDDSNDDTTALQSADSAARGASRALFVPDGTYKITSIYTLKPGLRLVGEGIKKSVIKCYNGAFVQSDQTQVVDYMELRDLMILNASTATTGLDVGTIRNSALTHVYVSAFTTGVALSMNVDTIGNYYNRLYDVVADCGSKPAGSVGFQIGNNISGHTQPSGNANVLIGCKSYGAETGIDIVSGIGNVIKGHQITSCTHGIALHAGSDNRVEAYIEGATDLGTADSGTTGNYLDLFDDATGASKFTDNGWNFVTGNVGAVGGYPGAGSGLGLPAPSRQIDCKIVDHIPVIGITGASINVFKIVLPNDNCAVRVVATFAGYITYTGNYCGVQEWAITKNNDGTPVITQLNTTGDNRFTVTAAADGTVTWAITGDAANTASAQIAVDILGIGSGSPNGKGQMINYQRLV